MSLYSALTVVSSLLWQSERMGLVPRQVVECVQQECEVTAIFLPHERAVSRQEVGKMVRGALTSGTVLLDPQLSSLFQRQGMGEAVTALDPETGVGNRGAQHPL